MKRINSIVKHELRKSLCNKYGGKCSYCGTPVGMAGTVDHYMPQALGGTNDRENLRWCCIECNRDKADMHPQEWEQRIPVRRPSPPTKQQQKAALLSSIAQRSVTNA